MERCTDYGVFPGYICGFLAAYIAAGALFTELFNFAGAGGSALIFVSTKRSKKAARNANKALDVEEKPVEKVNPQDAQASASEEKVEGLAPTESIFTWKDVCYTVPTADGPRQLLHDITGWVKPGETTALMGASGAGKTTLLNTLSQRMNPAQVSGDILVDGKRPGLSFPRETGFAEQVSYRVLQRPLQYFADGVSKRRWTYTIRRPPCEKLWSLPPSFDSRGRYLARRNLITLSE